MKTLTITYIALLAFAWYNLATEDLSHLQGNGYSADREFELLNN